MIARDKTGGSVAVISSHVARGAVGNRAAVFALEALGIPVVAVPTVLLPWHPGHGAATRLVHDDEQFAAFMADLAHGPFASEIAAIISGYLGTPAQARIIAETVQAIRRENGDVIYLCDPVIGDENGLYVSDAVVDAVRTHLVPIADICTPNRHELAWLTTKEVGGRNAIVAAARSLDCDRVLVTSAFPRTPDRTGNAIITATDACFAGHDALGKVPNGTGDLTAALFMARILSGCPDEDALRLTTASVHEMLERTRARGADELSLAPDADVLVKPRVMPAVERVLEQAVDRDR